MGFLSFNNLFYLLGLLVILINFDGFLVDIFDKDSWVIIPSILSLELDFLYFELKNFSQSL